MSKKGEVQPVNNLGEFFVNNSAKPVSRPCNQLIEHGSMNGFRETHFNHDFFPDLAEALFWQEAVLNTLQECALKLISKLVFCLNEGGVFLVLVGHQKVAFQ